MLGFPQANVRRDARTLLTDGPGVCVFENGLELDEIKPEGHIPFPNAVHSLRWRIS
jgi:hypothetical protein